MPTEALHYLNGNFAHYMRMIPLSEANLETLPSYDKDYILSDDPHADLISGQALYDSDVCAIVTKSGKPIGYLNFSDLYDVEPEATPTASELMRHFRKTQFLKPTTSLYEAHQLLGARKYDHDDPWFFVPRKEETLAVVDPTAVWSGNGIRICVYAAVSNLEISMLDLLHRYSSESIVLLKPPYLHDAIELYEKKGFQFLHDGGYNRWDLLNCTTFATKMHLVRQLTCFKNLTHGTPDRPWFRDESIQKFNDIRNWLAHPDSDKSVTHDDHRIHERIDTLIIYANVIGLHEAVLQILLAEAKTT